MCLPFHYIFPKVYKTYRNNTLYRMCVHYRSKMKVSFYHTNGQVRRVIHYKNHKLDGPCIQYFSNGTVEKLVYYVNGVRHGKMYENYTEDKNYLKQTGYFHCGKQNGEFYHYSKNGSLLSIYNYRHGAKHGKQYSFYDNQNIESEQSFRYGELDGNSYFYDRDGHVKSQIYFMKGIQVFENKQLMELEECSICFEETNFKTKCKHQICIECKEKVSSCPICRRHLL